MPQNRNSHISHAVINFLHDHDQIESITMKYSLPGHSCVQEVDNMHKNIDDAMRCAEFYSPLGFLRLLLKVDRKKTYHVIQMQSKDFRDYANCAKMLKYNNVPYTKVSQLRFEREAMYIVKYKLSHSDVEFTSVSIGTERKTRNRMSRTGKAIPTYFIASNAEK